MEAVVIAFAIGAVLGGLVVLAFMSRRTPTIGQGEMPGQHVLESRDATMRRDAATQGDSATPRDAATPPGTRVSKTIVTKRFIVAGKPVSETVTVNGRTYPSLDAIPDAATREQLRSALAAAVDQVSDPTAQRAVRDELAELTDGQESTADPQP